MRRLFNVCVRVLCPNSTILFVYIPAKIHSKRWFFLENIFCKSVAGPFSEAKTYWMVNWLQLLNQLNFVLRYIKIFLQNSSQWCLRNVQLLRTKVNWYWWRFTHTFCHNSNILGCMHCFWLFHKITNIRSWLCLSSYKIRTQFSNIFCNITMIFKVISEYFPALFKRIHNNIHSMEG